jgi:Na+-driven multidrug efflux pump
LSIVLGAMLRSLGVLRAPFLVQATGSLVLLPLAGLLAFGAGWQLQGLLAAQGGIALVRAGVMALIFHRVARQRDGERLRAAAAAGRAAPAPSSHHPLPQRAPPAAPAAGSGA